MFLATKIMRRFTNVGRAGIMFARRVPLHGVMFALIVLGGFIGLVEGGCCCKGRFLITRPRFFGKASRMTRAGVAYGND
jgi:hypothetical protein